jgi:hypothetical protein
LWFADDAAKKAYDCRLCLKNPSVAKERRCQEPGYQNLKKPRRVDARGLEFPFCPGKATWAEDTLALFEQCRIALETGIMPKEGSLEDQPAEFVDAFPLFVQRWRDRNYGRIWSDVQEFTSKVLEAVLGKKKGGSAGGRSK